MRNKDRDDYEPEGTPCGTGCCGVRRKRECDGHVTGHCGSYTCSVCYGPGEDHSFCKNEKEEENEVGNTEQDARTLEEILDAVERLKGKVTGLMHTEGLYSVYKEVVGSIRPLPFREAWQVLANAMAFAERQTGSEFSSIIVPEHKEGDVAATAWILLLHSDRDRETVETVMRAAGRNLVREHQGDYGYGVAIHGTFYGVTSAEETIKREATLLVCVKENELATFVIGNGVAISIPPLKHSVPPWTLLLALTEEEAVTQEAEARHEAEAYKAETIRMHTDARVMRTNVVAEA